MAADLPPRFVLPDLALAGIVQRPPRTRDELQSVRGLDGRHLRNGAAEKILAAIEEGLDLDPSLLHLPDAAPIDRSLGAAVTVVGAWLSQRAAELDLDPALLATRSDLSLLLSGVDGRLSHGWRTALIGEPIRRLMQGDAVLALANGGRRLILEDRHH
ncbi:MAG: HRDC domain-containing protein [Acidimicrobiia bacterium]|nr:HRDC domain-containing protein [Acidimicrobiia bacterium]